MGAMTGEGRRGGVEGGRWPAEWACLTRATGCPRALQVRFGSDAQPSILAPDLLPHGNHSRHLGLLVRVGALGALKGG